jgi:L-amino acid N-acyltransferase YncA
MTNNIVIKPAKSENLLDINQIFNYYVDHSTCVWTTTPYSDSERKVWFEAHSENMPVIVAESNGNILGWGSLSSFREAYTVNGTLEDSIYVHYDYLRKGIGSRLLGELIEIAKQNGLRSILANISSDQEPSIRLHEKFGFEKVAHIRQVGWKFNKRLDAVYLQLLLNKIE